MKDLNKILDEVTFVLKEGMKGVVMKESYQSWSYQLKSNKSDAL